MFLEDAPESPDVDRLYKTDLDLDGYVMNLTRLWAWRPEVCGAFSALRSLLARQSSLSPRERGVLVCAATSALGDSYCSLAQGATLAKAAGPSTAAAVLRGSASDSMSARERTLAAWARKVAKNPNSTTREDVEALRAAGLSEREIFEATAYVAFRLAFSTVNDALGAEPDWQVAEAAPSEVRSAVTFGRPAAARAR
jgi:uncharacterized peroxidase-related enzyme